MLDKRTLNYNGSYNVDASSVWLDYACYISNVLGIIVNALVIYVTIANWKTFKKFKVLF